jgi:hypothetical protein
MLVHPSPSHKHRHKGRSNLAINKTSSNTLSKSKYHRATVVIKSPITPKKQADNNDEELKENGEQHGPAPHQVAI